MAATPRASPKEKTLRVSVIKFCQFKKIFYFRKPIIVKTTIISSRYEERNNLYDICG
jgi:hypothetical protein